MSENNFIWIYGENRAESACENSFNFWKYALTRDDSIDNYFILKKNKNTLKIYDTLSEIEKEHIIWHNSNKHKELFKKADMCFVSDSFYDVSPTEGSFRRKDYPIEKPLIFLQKDSNSIFNSRITGESNNSNIFRYCVYDRDNLDILIEKNNFKDYQLRYVKFPLKFNSDFVLKEESVKNRNLITWVVEWRYYGSTRQDFIDNIVSILKSEDLNNYLSKNNLTLKVCLHRYYKKDMFEEIYNCSNDHIQVTGSNVLLPDDIHTSRLLITDYSSYAFDFSLLKRRVLLYQPDFDFVKNKHDFLIDADDINNIKTSSDLISAIVNETDIQNPFLNMWDDTNFEEIKKDSHIKELYDYFVEKQQNKITFIGYNFFGAGGTVSSTKALAEGLVQKDYFVELYSIVRTDSNNTKLNGINLTYGFYRHTKSYKDKIKYKAYHFTKRYGYLGYEENVNGINPYSNCHLKKYLKNIKSNTVVSTRETLHLFLEECESDFIKNKIYFFHAPADTIDVMYPGLIHKLKEKTLNKAVFVTENNRLALKKLFNYDNYNKFTVIGNALEENKIINKNDITTVPKKDKYVGIYLLRLSVDRIDDLNNLINFAKYLKENNISNIIIDVFGGGRYAKEFMDIVYDNNLDNIINYRGKTNFPFSEIKNHDFMADFTLNHSFGMIYIEGVLAGRKVFCMENPGSIEVMGSIDNTYIESFEWLVKQINNISDISLSELHKNYEIIMSNFSQNAVSEKFLDFLD